jgi:hypothetical protein
MKSTLFHKPAAVAVLLAIFALQFLSSPQSTAAQNPVNVSNEARALGQFGKSLGDFFNQAETLKGKPSRTPADITSLESNASRVKGAVSGFRNNLDAFIKKHKDANQWNAQFDSLAESNLAPELKDFARRNGGARRLFELALSDINNLNAEIDEATGAVKRLRIGSLDRGPQIERVAFTPAPAFRIRAKCVALFVVSTVAGVAGADLAESEATKAFQRNKCGSFADSEI